MSYILLFFLDSILYILTTGETIGIIIGVVIGALLLGILFMYLRKKRNPNRGGAGQGQALTQSVGRMTPQQTMASTAPISTNVLRHIESFSYPTINPPPGNVWVSIELLFGGRYFLQKKPMTGVIWLSPVDHNVQIWKDPPPAAWRIVVTVNGSHAHHVDIPVGGIVGAGCRVHYNGSLPMARADVLVDVHREIVDAPIGVENAITCYVDVQPNLPHSCNVRRM